MLLEFGTLSRLTGNPLYEQKAKHAMMRIYGECIITVLRTVHVACDTVLFDVVQHMLNVANVHGVLLDCAC